MADKNQLKIEIRGKIATLKEQNFQLVGGNSDYEVVFDFDDDWSDQTAKTAIFVFGKNEPVRVVFDGNICEGVAIEGATMCLIGVVAGDVKTTTPAMVECLRSISDEANGSPKPPTEDVYNQIMELINRYINAVRGAPSGGLRGQVLKKNSDKDYDYSWQDDVAGEALKEVQNITSIDTIYNDKSALPTSNVSNGTRYVALSNGKIPPIIYSWSAADNKWREIDEVRPSTAYIVLSGEKAGMYRYTMSPPYFLSVESHTLQEAKEYADEAIKKYHEENPVKDGVSPTISVEPIENGHKVIITDVNGVKEFDVPNGSDYVITDEDIAELSQKVQRVLYRHDVWVRDDWYDGASIFITLLNSDPTDYSVPAEGGYEEIEMPLLLEQLPKKAEIKATGVVGTDAMERWHDVAAIFNVGEHISARYFDRDYDIPNTQMIIPTSVKDTVTAIPLSDLPNLDLEVF